MSTQQLLGLQARLQRELAEAFGVQPWPAAVIERLANDFADSELALAEFDANQARDPATPLAP